eukprot:Opistho-1_new@45896
MRRDQPGAAGADHEDEGADARKQQRRVERRLRQYVREQRPPVADARAEREPGQREHRREHAERDQERRAAPCRARGAQARRLAPRNQHSVAGKVCPAMQGHWSKPTLSTRALACLRYLAISVSGSGSTFSSPMDWPMIGSRATPLRTGYS